MTETGDHRGKAQVAPRIAVCISFVLGMVAPFLPGGTARGGKDTAGAGDGHIRAQVLSRCEQAEGWVALCRYFLREAAPCATFSHDVHGPRAAAVDLLPQWVLLLL